MIEPIKQLGKKFYKLLSTDTAMQDFLNEEIYAGIWFWDLHQRNHIWLSPTLNKLLGFEKDFQPVIPHSWNELIPKDYIDNLANSFENYLATDHLEHLDIDIPFLEKNKRINILKCKSIAVHNNAYLLGLVQLHDTQEEVRATDIMEFPFIHSKSEIVADNSSQLQMTNNHKENTGETEYESILITSNIGSWEYRVDTSELWCSNEYFDLLGYEMDSKIRWGKFDLQKVWTDLIHPDDLKNATTSFTEFVTDLKEGYQQNFRMRHANGSWIWISSIGKLMIKEIKGVNTLMVIGTHTDITKSKKIEESLFEANALLLKNNALLKSIISSPADTMILSIDTEYRFTFYPDRYQKFAKENFGKNIFIGYNVLDLFSDSQLLIFKPVIDAALRGEYNEINAIISVDSNKLINVNNKYNPILSEDGKIIGATIFINDVTKKHNAEIENKINELGYATLFLEANEAIIIANANTGFIVDANFKAMELLGYTKSELVNMHQTQLHPPEFLKGNGNRFNEFANSNEFLSMESLLLTKNGKNIPVQITRGSLFKIGDENFCAAYVKDITNKNLIKEELQKKNRQLNEIAWIQSYMVKAPLARLMGFSNALEKGIVSDIDKPVYLKHIKDSATELDCVIKEIKAKALVN